MPAPAKTTAVFHQTTQTGAHTATLTSPGFGDVKGVLLLYNNGRNDGIRQLGVRSSWGFAANPSFGSGAVAMGCGVNNGVATTNTSMSSHATRCLFGADGNVSNVIVSADITFITDGIDIDFVTNTALRVVIAIFFGGDNLEEVTVGEYVIDNGGNSINLGYEPEGVFFMGTNQTTATGTDEKANVSLGFLGRTNDTGHSCSFGLDDGFAAASSEGSSDTSGSNVHAILNGENLQARLEATTTATGFDTALTLGASAGSRRMKYMALKMTTAQGMWVGSASIGANGGNIAVNTMPWEPQSVFATLLDRGAPAGGHFTVNTTAYAQWYFDNTNNMKSVMVMDELGASPTSCSSATRDGSLGSMLYDDVDATDGILNDGNPTFTADGFSLDFTGTNGSSDLLLFIALQKETDGINNVYLGGTPLSSISIGGTPVQEVWVGGTQVWG